MVARSGKSRHGNLRGQVGQETSPQRCRIVQVSGTQAWVGLRSDSYVCTLHARSDHYFHHPHHNHHHHYQNHHRHHHHRHHHHRQGLVRPQVRWLRVWLACQGHNGSSNQHSRDTIKSSRTQMKTTLQHSFYWPAFVVVLNCWRTVCFLERLEDW